MQGARTRSVESPSGCHCIGMLRGVCAPVVYPMQHTLEENNDCGYCCTKTHGCLKITSAETIHTPKPQPTTSFHAGCNSNRSVESPEACHRIDTPRGVAHPLRTLCTIRSRKITTVVTVAPKHMGDLKLLPPKLHNKLKSPINRIISTLGRINTPLNHQRATSIGVGIVPW
jgi:hypothetical protein